MLFKPQQYSSTVDLTNLQSKQSSGKQIVDFIKPTISSVVEAVKSNNFDYSEFSFSKQQNSGLTGKSGLYLIINSKTKGVYLGGAADLAQRKGDHWRNFKNPARDAKLANYFKKDLTLGQPQDFVFVPLLILTSSQITGCSTINTSFNQEVSNFLDTFVEGPLIEDFLQTLPDTFYNVKSVGPFTQGNKFGGSPNSGKPSEAVAYESKSTNNSQRYAWESVSAAAKTFGVDRKLIRTKRDSGKMVKLTQAEFDAFTGIKISNAEAISYFANKPAVLAQLLSELFPNVAKKKASNGEP